MYKLPIPVQVRSRYHDGHWSRGFEITEVLHRDDRDDEVYRVRRRSDGAVLPVLFDPEDVRTDE
jgi:hypothetical protein